MGTVTAGAGAAEVVVCRPASGTSPWPGVLLCMDAFGLRPQLHRMAQRIADAGFIVMAPNTFYRTATVAEVAPTEPLRSPADRDRFFSHIRPHLQALSGDRMDADAPAYIAALRALPELSTGPIGVIGYCMGVRLAIRAAGLCPDDVTAVAGFHGGRLVTDESNSPHERLRTARAEFAFGHADNDPSMSPDDVRVLGETVDDAGLRAVNEVYSGAPHGFTMADTPSYDPAAAERAMNTALELFTRVLAGTTR